jgi:mono/diheme cytochrome c family protein
MRTNAKGLLALILVAGLAACGGESADTAPPGETAPTATEAAPAPEATPAMDLELPEGVTTEMVASGQTVFHGSGICYTCHMQDGVGGMLAPNLTDADWLNVDGEYTSIVELIKTGVPTPVEFPGMMPERAGVNLSDADVEAVAAYVWSLSQAAAQ